MQKTKPFYKLFMDWPWLPGFILLIAGWAINGMYLGWVDDVLFANCFAGTYTPKPIAHPGDFIGISNLLIVLYAKFPSIGWYGLFLFSAMLLAYFTNVRILNIIVERSGFSLSNILKVWLFLAYSMILNEFFVKNTFTSTACLLSGFGLLLFMISESKPSLLLGIISVTSGLLIRLETSLLIIVFVLMLLLLIRYDFKANKSKILKLFVLCASVIVLNLLIPNDDWRDFSTLNIYEFAIQDMYLYPKKSTPLKDNILLEAVIGWNTYDADILNKEFYKSIYDGWSINQGIIWDYFIHKMSIFMDFSIRYVGESAVMNWFGKVLCIIATGLMWQILIIYNNPRLRLTKKILLFNISIIGFVLFVALFAKMEDRLLYPILLLTLAGFALQYLNRKYLPQKWTIGIFVLLPFLLFSGYRYVKSIEISKLLKDDLAKKRYLMDELNRRFSNTTFLLDNFTPFLFQAGIFKNVRLNSKNYFILGPTYIKRHYNSINEFYTEECLSENINTILNCFSDQPDVVIMAWDQNIDFLKRWNEQIYDDKFIFLPILQHGELSDLNNVFLWIDMQYGYYTISKASE